MTTLHDWVNDEIADVFTRAADKIGAGEFDMGTLSDEEQAGIPAALFGATLYMQAAWSMYVRDAQGDRAGYAAEGS